MCAWKMEKWGNGNEYSHIEESKVSLVSDPPTVWTQKVSIAQQSSIYLELVCWVEANPFCQPQWVKIEEEKEVKIVNLGKSSRQWVENRGKEKKKFSVIVIKNPENQHFGKYVCSATNILGESHQMVELEGQCIMFSVVERLVSYPKGDS